MSGPTALPDAASVLRRALVVWGLGHLALGDRRGWLLLLLQPLAIAAVAFIAVELIDGTRWLAVFAPLLVLLVVWLGQAIHAHRRAITMGAAPGGEMQIAATLPFALVIVTAFWLYGGRHGSPAATVEAYMEAWMANRPDAGAALFDDPRTSSAVMYDLWASQRIRLTQAMDRARIIYGPTSGLDPNRPFNSLRVSQTSAGDGQATFVVELVRSERYETTVLGLIPTASQRTVVVQPVMQIMVFERPDPPGLLPSSAWRVDHLSPSETV